MAKKRRLITPNSLSKTPNKLEGSLRTLANAIVTRAYLGERLGKSYYGSDGTGAKRDLYKVLGYIKDPTFDDY